MSVCCSISVAEAVSTGYTLSKATATKFRFIDISRLLNHDVLEALEFDAVDDPSNTLSGGIPEATQPYAAISYPWSDLKEPEGSEKSDFFPNADLDPKRNAPTSVKLLKTVCQAAELEGCKYLWMDKLCTRQDTSSEEGKGDNEWQMNRMYSVYENCQVCLVAAGGPLRLPKLYEKTAWIDRAWTLQEALAPPAVLCMFEWQSGNKIMQAGNMADSVQQVGQGVAMAPLHFLLAANLHADVPVLKDVKDDQGTVSRVLEDVPQDQDSQVWYFSYRNEDDWPVHALADALARPNPTESGEASESQLSARRLGIWRCISMRSASYPEDFVFATMGIFGVTVSHLVDPRTNRLHGPGYLQDEIQELLNNYLIHLASKGSRADWLAVAPEIGPARDTSALPLVPDINFPKGRDGKLKTPFKKLLNELQQRQSNDTTKFWDGFNWYLGNALKYTVDAPNGIEVTAPAHAIACAGVLPEMDPPRPSFARAQDSMRFEVTDGGDRQRYAVAVGKKARYMSRGDLPLIQDDINVVLLMLLEYIPFTMQRFRNIGYAWVGGRFTDGWQEKTLGVGLRGG